MNKHHLKELERRIDEVLYYFWDPIGVSDIPAARGEYSSYTTTVLKYVLTEDIKKIAHHLNRLESDSMGMTSNSERNLNVAERLVEFKDAVEKGLK